jgi:oxepin-CoA hydrolase / 3-oxo-5,6-dehydrosuberyl-CoA semialdehyde dehydrogenase
MTFHERAWMLKDLALRSWPARKSCTSSATRPARPAKTAGSTSRAAPGTLFSFSSKGRRELPDGPHVLLDGDVEPLSKSGSFVGQHVYHAAAGRGRAHQRLQLSRSGDAGKAGPTLLAGVPAIVKPASRDRLSAEAAFRIMIDSGLLPKGAVQLVVGSTGDLLDHLTWPGRGELHRLGFDGDEASVAPR